MRTGWLAGVAVALVAAVAGLGIHAAAPNVPWLTASLVLGVIAGCIVPARPFLDGVLKPGLALSSRRLLRLGIVLLGLKLSLGSIAALGWVAIVAIVLLVGISFVLTWLIARAFRLEGDQPVLMAAGFSICGVSAIGAMSAARGTEKDASTPIALVTLCGTAAIAVLPALAPLLGLTGIDFGRWTGASVHDVGQVVATAQAAGAAALAAAVVIKLTRVLMLAPMIAIASIAARRSSTTSARPPVIPLFILGFIALVLVRSFLPVPDAVLGIADTVQSVLLAAALFAIGASLRLETLLRSGARALGAAIVSWVLILALAYALVRLT
jgi:uncharacterized integral membrane protein (TIGR00698 family)